MGDLAAAGMTVPAILVIGDVCADIVVELDAAPVFGQAEHLVTATTVTLGGSSAITACGTATMGVPTSLVSAVGQDLLGSFLLEQLGARGVDVAGCRVDASTPTGSSTILTLPDGDRSILTAMGTIGTTTTDDVSTAALSAAAHVHVGSYFLQSGLFGRLGDFYADCRSRGQSTSLDPNFDPRETWDDGIADVLAHTDVFFCNELEACAIAGVDNPDAAVTWLLARLPDGGELVLKGGADGAAVYSGPASQPARHGVAPPYDAGPLVDTVGAGDSLAAGYLAARVQGLPRPDCLRVGVRNGTASTRRAGGVNGQLTWAQATEL